MRHGAGSCRRLRENHCLPSRKVSSAFPASPVKRNSFGAIACLTRNTRGFYPLFRTPEPGSLSSALISPISSLRHWQHIVSFPSDPVSLS
jgi:hypothetical protein